MVVVVNLSAIAVSVKPGSAIERVQILGGLVPWTRRRSARTAQGALGMIESKGEPSPQAAASTAIGSDFDGAMIAAAIKDASDLPNLIAALRASVFDEDSIRKIAVDNWMRVFRLTWRQCAAAEVGPSWSHLCPHHPRLRR